MKRRTLTEEEKRLWDQVTHRDVPLHPKISSDVVNVRYIPAVVVNPRPLSFHEFSFQDPVPSRVYATPLALAGYAGIDRNSAERFRKGEMPLEGTIDLHGMTREKAHRALSQFIHAHYERGSRFVLAVTGK